MVETLEALEREYCPPLDPALVHAIYSDFSESPDGLQQARELLDGIKLTASEEQISEFDPSGSSGDTGSSPGKTHHSSEVDSNADSARSLSTVTDYTGFSNDFSNLNLSNGSEDGLSGGGGYYKDAAHMDASTKEQLLQETFPTLRPGIISFTLKKCNDDLSKTTDELLNHVYFEDSRSSPGEESAVAKGIDAFFEDQALPTRNRKGKGKKKKNTMPLHDSSSSSPDPEPVTTNRWQESNRDVDFIASRTNLSYKTVASLYHKNGAFIAATIAAAIEMNVEANRTKDEQDPVILQNGVDLLSDFPTIELQHAFALIRLTHPSTANAHELAKALLQSPTPSLPTSSTKVIPQYAPIHLSDATPASPSRPPSALPPSALSPTTASLSTARSQAFTQASAAYRKGRSTPLMKAAAGYYSQVGRDLDTALRATSAADADALVASQSTSTQLDLHGVSVQNATRIAKQKVQAWWDGLGEARIPGGGRGGVGDGYRIVTGLGRHSEGGKGKIGPAVAKALVAEGWKIEVGSGVVVVMGMARRR